MNSSERIAAMSTTERTVVRDASWREGTGLEHLPGQPQPVAILDTNALVMACCFEVRTGLDSLPTLLAAACVPCFIADHVPGEMREHLQRVAETQGLDLALVWRIWERAIAPRLQLVELPIGEYLRPEIAGIRHHDPRRGDPDDWPTLALAAFLAPAVIVSRDGIFYRLGYGAESDNWRQPPEALNRAATLEGEALDRILVGLLMTRLTATGAVGLAHLGRRFPWTLPAAALGTVWLAATVWRRRQGVPASVAKIGRALAPLGLKWMRELAEFVDLRESLITVQDPPWRRKSLAEQCARLLARSGRPMTPAELRDALASGARTTAAGIRRAVADHPSFYSLSGDLYGIGVEVPIAELKQASVAEPHLA